MDNIDIFSSDSTVNVRIVYLRMHPTG